MDQKSEQKWFRWISVAVGIQGLAGFVVKYLVTRENPLEVLFFQYLGALLTIVLLAVVKRTSLVLRKDLMVQSLLVGILISTSLATFYLGLSQTAATLVIPTRSLSLLIMALMVGLFVFGEKNQMGKRDWWGLLVGLAAVVLLVF